MVETKFKQTDIGLIPEDWEVKYVKDFTDCTAGGTPSTKMDEYWNGDIPWMNSGELNKRRIYNTHNFITKRGLENSSTKIIPENCVLIGLTGQGKTRGTVAINKISLSINQSIGAFYANSVYNSSYLFFNLQNRYEELRNLSSGDGGRGGLNLHILKSLQVPLPPLPEQQAIAEVLSDTDTWIESLEQLIAKKQLIKQGAMQKLLTPKEDWEVRELGDVIDVFRGGSPRPIQNFITNVSNGINWIKIGDTTPKGKYIKDTEEKIIPEGEKYSRKVNVGDFLLSNSMSFGRPYILQTEGCIHDGWLVLQHYDLHFESEFLYYLLTSKLVIDQYKRKAAGSGVLNLNKELVKSVSLQYPKISEQTLIATILSDMDAEIEALEQKLAKAQQIKQGLMQELLTGKIRLTLNN